MWTDTLASPAMVKRLKKVKVLKPFIEKLHDTGARALPRLPTV